MYPTDPRVSHLRFSPRKRINQSVNGKRVINGTSTASQARVAVQSQQNTVNGQDE